MMADEEGYSYPISSKVVEKVLTNLRIQQAIEENRQAIEEIQIPGALTFEDIWAMGFVNSEYVNQKIESTERVLTFEDISAMGFVNSEWVQAQIEATERVLNFDEISAMGFINADWVQDYVTGLSLATSSWVDFNFVSHNDLLSTLLQLPGEMQKQGFRTESQIQAMIGGLGYMTESQVTDLIGSMAMALSFDDIWAMGYRNENWINEQGYSTEGWVQDYVNGLGLAPTSWVQGNFVSSADFDSFLKGILTPEFIDDLTGTLMDVEVNDIKMNLNAALEGRPTFGQIPSVPITLGSGEKWELKSFLTSHHNWILGIFNLSDPMKNTLLVKTLGVGGSRIKQFDNCFRGTGSGLEGLTTSLNVDINTVSAKFENMNTLFENMRSDFENFAAMITEFEYGAEGTSATTNMKALLKLLKEAIGGLVYGGGNFSGVANLNAVISTRFDEAKAALDRLKAKAVLLKTCGAANLEW